ncbi:MAG TPA: electron transfer flavoprotein subunit alpha/FixB family protein [Candidatus Bathyarchaeota archaeon]|nr:electron transfer flavoprotein subunit alpha/FixB family protein [Candidatus Bathyarchaeota archaeon]
MSEYEGVWVFSENQPLMLELLGKGREIADKLQTELTAIVLGSGVKEKAEEAVNYGADKVYVVDDPKLETFQAERYLSALASLTSQYKPETFLIGSTKDGKALAARLATRLNTGCVTDCLQIEVTSEKGLTARKIVYGGNAIATITWRTKPQIATVPPRTFEKPEFKERKGQIIQVEAELEEPQTEKVEVKPLEVSQVKIEEADVIVSCGRGFEKKEDLALAEELAKVLNAQVGCSRPLAEDRKWFSEWIGLSGHKVKPSLYIACGISGVIQHVAGIRDSKIIVAINTDENAPIVEMADYIIVGDIHEMIPAITEAFKKHLSA